MRARSHRLLVAVAVAAVASRAPRIAAQPADVDRAKQEYDLGYQALQAAQYQAALEHYQRSYQLAPRPRTLFNIAQAEELLGRIDDAIAHYTQFLAQAEPRDAEFAAQARKKLDALAAQRPAAVAVIAPPPPADVSPPIVPPPPPPAARCRASSTGTLEVRSNLAGATVSVDGLVVGATADRDGAGPSLAYPLAAGEHDVVVEGPAAASWHQRVRAGDDEAIRVDVDFHAPRGHARAWRWGLAGVGVAGAATGGVLGVLALRDVASPDADRHARGHTRALETDALLVAAAAALYGASRLGPPPAVSATVRSEGAEAAR